jgi:hypothetical protein
MKKSLILAAGFMAMALAGSAQAATMFAVQNSSAADKFTVDDTGMVNAGGQPTNLGGNFGITLALAPTPTPAAPLATPQGFMHAATEGVTYNSAAVVFQHVSRLNASLKYQSAAAPNFSMYRINKDNAGVYNPKPIHLWVTLTSAPWILHKIPLLKQRE